MALVDTAPLPLDIAIEGVQVCVAGGVVPDHQGNSRAACGARRSNMPSACPATGSETEVFFSDLGHEYIRINAEYTT